MTNPQDIYIKEARGIVGFDLDIDLDDPRFEPMVNRVAKRLERFLSKHEDVQLRCVGYSLLGSSYSLLGSRQLMSDDEIQKQVERELEEFIKKYPAPEREENKEKE